MIQSTLVDTGPLVAFFDERDSFHDWTLDQMAGLRQPLLTCEAVLCESLYLLRRHAVGIQSLLEFAERGELLFSFQLAPHLTAVKRLMHRYANIPMSLADACLVRMSELHPNSQVLTLDGDFRVYRRNGRQVIPTVHPGS